MGCCDPGSHGRVYMKWVPFYKQEWGWINGISASQTPYPAVVYVESVPSGCNYGGGQPIWPEDGNDATPRGIPGNGGAGGVISASLASVSAYASFNGGLSGQPGDAQTGGPPKSRLLRMAKDRRWHGLS